MALGQLGCERSKEVFSPSRTYVAMCNKSRFDGYYFRKFTLPETDSYAELYGQRVELENNCQTASWFFLNRLDDIACVESVFPFEDYQDLEEAE